jgi:uncharacterized protein (DUF1697 family)
LKQVALLRAINLGGYRKLPMAELRALAVDLKLDNPRTYIASGNLVFSSALERGELEALLEAAIETRFGFRVEVIVRSGSEWSAYRGANPFPHESKQAPNWVMISVGKQAATEADLDALRSKASANEQVEMRGDALWIWFGDGAGRSRIGTGPSKSAWTTRNWRTVLALDEMA